MSCEPLTPVVGAESSQIPKLLEVRDLKNKHGTSLHFRCFFWVRQNLLRARLLVSRPFVLGNSVCPLFLVLVPYATCFFSTVE